MCPVSTRDPPKTPYERNKFSNSLSYSELQFYREFLIKESLTDSEQKFLTRLFNKKTPNASFKKRFVELLLKYKILRCHECCCSNNSLTEASKNDIRCRECKSKNVMDECPDSEVKINLTTSNTPYIHVFLKNKSHLL